ncbi:MAG: hypothetical protein KDA30_08465 [Phycisphaerales bacterium]|nr:hypothetical protein [Phycisphaerales bacterium]
MKKSATIGMMLAAIPMLATGPKAGKVLERPSQSLRPDVTERPNMRQLYEPQIMTWSLRSEDQPEVAVHLIDERIVTIDDGQFLDWTSQVGSSTKHPALIGTWQFNHTVCYERTAAMINGHDRAIMLYRGFAYQHPPTDERVSLVSTLELHALEVVHSEPVEIPIEHIGWMVTRYEYRLTD